MGKHGKRGHCGKVARQPTLPNTRNNIQISRMRHSPPNKVVIIHQAVRMIMLPDPDTVTYGL